MSLKAYVHPLANLRLTRLLIGDAIDFNQTLEAGTHHAIGTSVSAAGGCDAGSQNTCRQHCRRDTITFRYCDLTILDDNGYRRFIYMIQSFKH